MSNMPRLFSKDTADVEVTISNRTVFRVVGLILVAFIALAAIRQSAHALTLIGVSIFLALALNAPVHWLAEHLPGKRRGSRGLATGLSIGIILLVLAGFLALILPPLIHQTSNFIKDAPHLVAQIQNQNSGIGKFIREHNLEGQVNKLSQQLSDRLGSIGGSAVSTLGSIGSSIFSAVTVLVLTIMMLSEGPHWRSIFERFIPERHGKRVSKLGTDMLKVIQGYVNGQVILAAIASVLVLFGLLLFHVSSPLALMVVVFVCGLIPMVGHTIGAIIVTIVASFHSWQSALFMLLYYILYQQIENYVIQPRLQANSTNMSPLLVFIAVIVGANFGGLLGALVAIPVVGCIRIAVLDYLESKHFMTRDDVEDIKHSPKGI